MPSSATCPGRCRRSEPCRDRSWTGTPPGSPRATSTSSVSSGRSRGASWSTSRPENDVHKFLTTGQVRVLVAITPAWFGRPGGGIRFTLQEPATGLRDLVASGRLLRVQVVG